MHGSDPRLVLATGDLASAALEGLRPASRYVEPTSMQATAPRAAILKAPEADAEQADELLFGEGFAVLEAEGDFVFGQALRDGYVGWAEAEHLGDPGPPPTHRVAALATLAFVEPSIKAPVVHRLSMNALASVERGRGGF